MYVLLGFREILFLSIKESAANVNLFKLLFLTYRFRFENI